MSSPIQMEEFRPINAQSEPEIIVGTFNSAVENATSPQVAPNPLDSSNAEDQTGGGNTENWNIVTPHKDEYGILHSMAVHDGEDSVSVFARIKEEVGTIGKTKGVLYKMIYFGEEGIFDATITQRVSTGIDETVRTYVVVGPLKYNPLLTAAFHNRIVLNGNNFVSQNSHFGQSDKAMVIDWKVNVKYIIGFILVLCALTVVPGILVGMLCHNAGLGIGVSAGLAAVLSILTVVLMQLAK